MFWPYLQEQVFNMLVKIPDSHFVRDTDSMVLLNQNRAEKEDYYARVRLLQAQKQDINKVNAELASLKTEMGEIKHLLTKLLEKG